jgi:hypothetical protein
MSDLLRYALESSVCLTFFYAVYWVFLKNETFFSLNRCYLVTALALSFLIPGLGVPSPFRTIRISSMPTDFLPSAAVSSRSFGWGELLLALYAAGALLFFARLVFHLVKLGAVVQRRGWRRYQDCKVVSVDREFAPFSFLNIVFMNEAGVRPDDLERILAHERVHIRQGHSLDILLMEMAITLQWFNPFVWPYKKSLQETHEYLADDGVIAQGFSAARYKRLVFEQHVGAQLFEFANNFKQSQIKRRLTMMSKIKSGNAAKLKLFVILPMATLLALAFAEPRPVRAVDPVVVPAPQEAAGQGQEEGLTKDQVAQAEKDLKALEEKETMLRQKLEAASGQEAQMELKKNLEMVLHKRQEILIKLGRGKTRPPHSAEGLKVEIQKLKEDELKIREVLAKTDDPEKTAQLKEKLRQVLEKQSQVEVMLAAEGSKAEPSIADLKEQYKMLDQKAADVRAKLQETKDAQQKAELEDLLKKIAMKQEKIKIEAEKIKAAQEKKKN